MNDTQKAKLIRFLDDPVMSDTVYQVLRNSFLKSKGQRDVQVLAAERLAIDLLEGGWRELERYKSEDPQGSQTVAQVGM